jgi:3-oxoacyl-[acyl-carrier protein] reductase
MKTVIITGGSRGIGKGLVTKFAKSGYDVLFGYNRSENEAFELCGRLSNEGFKTHAIKCDVTVFKDCENLIKSAIKLFGKIDVLVNNAGIAHQKLFTEITEAEWDEMFDVNVKSVYRLCSCALPDMIRKKKGCIINISSVWGIAGASCEVHYSAAKAAVIGFTKSLAKEVGPSGIRVNSIAPGIIETDMLSGFSKEEKKALACDTPLCSLGKPEDIALAALYLAEADFVTGQVLSPNGGFVI